MLYILKEYEINKLR